MWMDGEQCVWHPAAVAAEQHPLRSLLLFARLGTSQLLHQLRCFPELQSELIEFTYLLHIEFASPMFNCVILVQYYAVCESFKYRGIRDSIRVSSL